MPAHVRRAPLPAWGSGEEHGRALCRGSEARRRLLGKPPRGPGVELDFSRNGWIQGIFKN